MTSFGGNLGFSTPYDALIPQPEDEAGQVYVQIMRVYLALCEGILKPTEAAQIVAQFKEHPAFRINPIDPCLLPISAHLKNKIITNIQTLKKYNLATADAIRSAISFTFIDMDAPLTEIDERVLAYLIRQPTASFPKVGRDLKLARRTVLRAVRRLQAHHLLRFHSIIDTTAFGINSFMLFFRLRPEVGWRDIELGLAEFPFTKGILKATMTNSGYVSFLFPGGSRRVQAFRKSINDLKQSIFEEATLHSQMGASHDININLYHNGLWEFPSELSQITARDATELNIPAPHTLRCRGPHPALTPFDYIVASQLRLNSRISKKELLRQLSLMGFQVDSAAVSASLSRIRQEDVILPTLSISGIGIPTNFCFEIICNEEWRERILSYMSLLPSSITYLSDKGIILWLSTPAEHQVQYYRIFQSLESQDGVSAVNPIMTTGSIGTRSMDDIVQYMDPAHDRWVLEPDYLDLTRYLPF